MATAIAARTLISSPKAKLAQEIQRKSEIKTSWAGRVPYLKPGRYADGMPLHEVEYLACKLILKPNRFRSRKNLFDFAKVLRAPADQVRSEILHGEFRKRTAQDPGSAVCGYQGLPAVQQRIHSAPAHPLYRRLPFGRARNSVQVQTSGYTESRRNRRAPRDRWRLSGKVQVPGLASQRPAWRDPHALFSQRAVPTLTCWHSTTYSNSRRSQTFSRR